MDMSIEVSMPHYELKCNYTTEKCTYLINVMRIYEKVHNERINLIGGGK
jgi:hypothetical protein